MAQLTNTRIMTPQRGVKQADPRLRLLVTNAFGLANKFAEFQHAVLQHNVDHGSCNRDQLF